MTERPHEDPAGLNAHCLARFAFRGWTAGAVCVVLIWGLYVLVAPPWWLSVPLSLSAGWAAARVSAWAARRHAAAAAADAARSA